MDATLKGIPLTKKDVKIVFNEILKIDVNDDVSFQIISIKDIRLEDIYGGFRLNILSKLNNNKTYINIELTTGDIITPKEMKYNYKSIFENKEIPIMTYTLETVLAEKFETVITRALFNTRLKDFYDIYVIINTKMHQIKKDILVKAIINTFEKRETSFDIKRFKEIINDLVIDNNMNDLWNKFVIKNRYAKNVKFIDTINAINKIINILESELVEI